MKFILTLLIKVYIFLKPTRTAILTSLGVVPHSCRYSQSCSAYSIMVINKYGTIKGILLALKRFSSCYPH